MEKVIAYNAHTAPVRLGDSTVLAPGASAEVPATAVGKGAIKAGIIQIMDEVPAADESPVAPDAGGSDNLPPLTADEVAAKLFAEPELIPEDGLIGSGAPSTEAMAEAFGRDFSADERNVIWEKVKELQVGSLNS